jgi:predicted kinase
MAGLPGTGKSTIARVLASETGGIVLDKDRIRAALFPEHWIEYSQRQDDFCVEMLLQAAAYLLTAPRVPPFIFIDGRVFAFRHQIKRIIDWAIDAGCRLKIIHAVCSDETAHERLRAGDHVATNRTYDLYLEIKARFEPIEQPKLTLDTDESLESSVSKCLEYLRVV